MIRKALIFLQLLRVALAIALPAVPVLVAWLAWPEAPARPVAARPVMEVTAAAKQPTNVTVPILMYHDTPADFELQLQHLLAHGYTAITLDELAGGMQGAALPMKPIIITYDDGFANQMQAYDVLSRHQVKATFYIIMAGEASGWCIGAGRRPGDCGDSYLSWDQIRQLDRSGLITMGVHTVNHRDLASLSPDEQAFELREGKAALERELGHAVRHLAYPYGSYNEDSVRIAREVGFMTAVTTQPGVLQAAGSELELRRVRDVYSLR